MHKQEIIANLERIWQSLDTLCASLTAGEWQLPTDCPGWSVQDQVAHLIDFESQFLGKPMPAHTPGELRHVKNDLGKRNEVWVDWYRSRSGAEVLADFRAVLAARRGMLAALDEQDLDAPSSAAGRPETLRDHLQRRIIDCWVHEQDIRRAVGRPGHFEGPVLTYALGRLAEAMGYVLGKKVGAAPGTTAVFVITGAFSRTLALRMEGGRARPLDPVPPAPTVRLTMDAEAFACLGYGRWQPSAAMAAGRLRLEGDLALGQAIAAQMSVTP